MLPPDRPLSEVEFVAFDLETTGLFPVVNRIVEFGAVRFTLDGRELGTWEQLVNPECVIPPGVTEIHGITDAMVRGQATLAQALPGFLEFLGDTDAILLAHNATFDLPELRGSQDGAGSPSEPGRRHFGLGTHLRSRCPQLPAGGSGRTSGPG
jgi:DNA polymerase-3 subunit epsilon